MIKNLKGWEMFKKLKIANVYLRHFTGVKVRCMRDHIKPTLKEKLGRIVLHIGENGLDSDRPPDVIAKSVADVASSMKVEKHDVTVSNIVIRANQFKEKSKEVNDYLSKLCMGRNIYLTDHSKILEIQHLNERKFYLNRRCVPIL